MNQIIFNKEYTRKKKNFFKLQFGLSVAIILVVICVIMNNYNYDENLENISEIIDKNAKLSQIYRTNKTKSYETYLGKIIIESIDLEYTVFNNYNETLLKIAPCKFFGNNLGEKGNICIAGHNYNDNRFFSRIAELNIKDNIKLIDLEGNEYNYIVYDNFEISEDDFSILKQKKKYELTLLTCNNSNKKRVIIKAYMKEY